MAYTYWDAGRREAAGSIPQLPLNVSDKKYFSVKI
jgi:hypothetical protein